MGKKKTWLSHKPSTDVRLQQAHTPSSTQKSNTLEALNLKSFSEGIYPPKYYQYESPATCSSAEPASVLVQQIKSQNQTPYLQRFAKSSHVQSHPNFAR